MLGLSPFEGPVQSNFNFIESPLSALCKRSATLVKILSTHCVLYRGSLPFQKTALKEDHLYNPMCFVSARLSFKREIEYRLNEYW